MMGFFDKVKNAVGSKKEDESQNSDEAIDKLTSDEQIRNFKYLDDLIHSGAKEIVLDSDITLSDDEESGYEDGIIIDVGNLVIDGAGHSIDAVSRTGIFKINSKVTLKSLTLKNGHASYGGAINVRKGGDVQITDCQFQKNAAEHFGGAIYNGGELTIGESALNENTADNGGAIYNSQGSLTITESTLDNNTANMRGGAIKNYEGNFKISNCEFSNNNSPNNIILNEGSLQIHKTIFTNNQSVFIIFNYGEMSNLSISS